MKKSITISVAIILAVVVIALYKGAHQHLTAFDVMLFVTMFFIGVLAGNWQPEKEHTALNMPSEAEEIQESQSHKYWTRMYFNATQRQHIIDVYGSDFDEIENPIGSGTICMGLIKNAKKIERVGIEL